MKHTNIYQISWAVLLLLAATLACAGGPVGEQIDSVRQTAENAVDTGKSAISTAQALATQAGPILETASAFATEQGPGMLETAQAAATEFSFGDQPEDIPLPDSASIQNLVTSNKLVTFTTSLSLAAATDFYKSAMPENGWNLASGERVETDSLSILHYEKTSRSASVTISVAEGKTVVLIVIETP